MGLPKGFKRWTPGRKVRVLTALELGDIKLDTVIRQYGLTVQEIDNWRDLFARHGVEGLRVTRLQQYRK